MTDKEIIKALECCTPENESCLNCPLIDVSVPECAGILYKATIDLINRQQAEIEELKHEREVLLEDIHHSADQINEQIEELEDARREIERLRETNKAIMQTMADVHTEAIKEFAERLKEKYPWKGDYLYSTRRTVENIDNLVKKMVGEQE